MTVFLDPDHTCKARVGDRFCEAGSTVRITFPITDRDVSSDLCEEHCKAFVVTNPPLRIKLLKR